MPLMIPAIAVRLPPPGNRLVPVCILLSALALGGSLVLLPFTGASATSASGVLTFVQQLLSLVAAGLGLLSGALGMFAPSTNAPVTAAVPSDPAVVTGLQALVRQLTSVLEEQHGHVAAFQEIHGNSAREALVVSRRLALLSDVAIDAESRLVAGVAQADEALRNPALAGHRTADPASRALPEIGELIRRGMAEQSRAIASSLDAVAARMVTDADGPVQAFRNAVAGATGQIKTLAETAVTLSRDVIAFDTAGRGIATASTAVVSRVNDAVAHVDAALAQLPDAAAMVMAAADQAAQRLTESADALRTDSAALAISGQQVQHAAAVIQDEAEALRVTRQDITDASATMFSRIDHGVTHVDAALAQLPEAAAMLTTAAGQAAQAVAESANALRIDSASFAILGQQVQQAAAVIQDEAEALRTTRQDMTHETANMLSRFGDGAARVDAAIERLPVVVDAMVAASERTERIVSDATRMIANDSASLAAAGQDTHTAAISLRQEVNMLKTAGHGIAAAGHQTIAAVTQAVETAVAQLGAVIADADIARQGTTGLAHLAATLESAAATLVDGAYSLDAAGNRVATEGDKISERLATDAARNGEMLHALPDVAARMMAAMEALKAEAALLTAAAEQVSSAGQAATFAATAVAARAETSAASLENTGQMINAASQDVALRIGQLTQIAGYTETQASLLPAVAADIAAAAARLQIITEAWRPDEMLTILPDAAARLDAAGPRLEQLQTLSTRLENVVAGLEAGHAQEAALATMAVLSTDIGEAVRRVEAALNVHEEAWPAMIASMTQAQTAPVALVKPAAVNERVTYLR